MLSPLGLIQVREIGFVFGKLLIIWMARYPKVW